MQFQDFSSSFIISAIIIYSQLVLADSDKKVSWGGFIDGQYAFDFNNPPDGDRSFTTQPSRANEFNINLAFIEAKAESSKTRSRFALQTGTSVQSNYLSEPQKGSISGGELSRHIQEARVGYKVSENTWLDAGIFFAHVGSESFISKDNLTLTRSLVAEFSPYYLSGVKLTHSFSNQLTGQLLVTNGWQNISENNTDKNVGTGIEFANDQWSLAYNTLLGREVSADLNGSARGSEFRHFHDFILKSHAPGPWEWVAQYDVGFQKKQNFSTESQWQGATLLSRYSLNADQKIALRLEAYQDRDQIIIVTNEADAFNGYGLSVGFDQILPDGIFWRSELRYLKATRDIFPKESKLSSENMTATTSWAVSF